MFKIKYFLCITALMFIPFISVAQDLLIGKTVIDITKSSDIYSDDISGLVHFDADTKTLTLNNATVTNAIIQNNNVKWLNICLIGDNKINNDAGALFLLQPTSITGDGSLTTSCAKDYSDIYHEASMIIEDCTIEVTTFRGVFNAFLEIRNASITSLRGIYWHSGVALKDCEIVQPIGGVYDENEHAISLNGWIYKNKVVIARSSSLSVYNPDVCNGENVIYDINGHIISDSHNGLCIIRYTDGKTKKV